MEDYYHKSTNRPKIFGMTAPQSEKVSRPLKIQGFKGNVVRFISVVQYGNFLQEVLSIIEGSHGYKKLLKFVNSGSGALSTGQISSKLHGLLEIFRSFGYGNSEKLPLIVLDTIFVKNWIL